MALPSYIIISNQDQILLVNYCCAFFTIFSRHLRCTLSMRLEREALLEGDPCFQKLPDSQQGMQDVAPNQVHGLPVSCEKQQ